MTNEIIEGDCLDVMPTLGPKSVDLVLTDPPYAMPATYYQGTKYADENGRIHIYYCRAGGSFGCFKECGEGAKRRLGGYRVFANRNRHCSLSGRGCYD